VRVSRRGAGCGRSEDGATSIEFALIAAPLVLLIGAIFHVGAGIWLSAALDQAALDAARLVRQFPADGHGAHASSIKSRLCARATLLMQCQQRLDLRLSWFATLSEARAAIGQDVEAAWPGDTPDGGIALIEARYDWPLPGAGPPPAVQVIHVPRPHRGDGVGEDE
jgi:Flp pilus assembly pilin Flp